MDMQVQKKNNAKNKIMQVQNRGDQFVEITIRKCLTGCYKTKTKCCLYPPKYGSLNIQDMCEAYVIKLGEK